MSKTGREAAVLIFMAALVFWLSGKYDVLERLVDFARAHEAWELDEVITTLTFLAFVLFFFVIRRWIDARRLQKVLAARNLELERAMDKIQILEGHIPICSGCKKVRDDTGFWQQVELYVESRSKAQFSHSLCPECMEAYYGNEPWYKKLDDK